jgi:Putative heavy-metal-binding
MKNEQQLIGILLSVAFGLLLASCFRPVIPISTGPKYPVDIFYENQQPERPFTALKSLETHREDTLSARQNANGRMLARGNDMQQKELLMARMSMEAKKLGADALVNVRYQYYTSTTANGYSLRGTAVKYQAEN